MQHPGTAGLQALRLSAIARHRVLPILHSRRSATAPSVHQSVPDPHPAVAEGSELLESLDRRCLHRRGLFLALRGNVSRVFPLDEGQWRGPRPMHPTAKRSSYGAATSISLRLSVLHAHFWKRRGLEDALGVAETRSHFTVECRSLLGS